MIEIIHTPSIFRYLAPEIFLLDDVFPELRGACCAWDATCHADDDGGVILALGVGGGRHDSWIGWEERG
jgi:hypothetical protein